MPAWSAHRVPRRTIMRESSTLLVQLQAALVCGAVPPEAHPDKAGFFQALSGATTTYGIQAYGQGTGTNSYGAYMANAAAATNHGVYALASNGTALNYGVRAIASGGTTNYGVHGTAAVGTNFAGYFAGDLMCTGTPYSTAGGAFFRCHLEDQS